MKPTLLVLAAGMGSRYGSLKQMDGVGPNNEAIIDYSIYDAIRTGFGKVVFVIRDSFATQFREIFNEKRYGGKIEVEYVFQDISQLPEGYELPEGREKPWGTNHAILAAVDVIDNPFAVINADDFYGYEAYKVMSQYLQSIWGRDGEYSMVAYSLKNTLSDFGTVSRGECVVDSEGYLVSVTERLGLIRKDSGEVIYRVENGEVEIADSTPVSMNFFGFTPDYFQYSQEGFREFLDKNMTNLKSEFFIPTMVTELITNKKARMKVLNSDAKWFGVTYKEDKPIVEDKIRRLIEEGSYPQNLFSNI